MARNRKADLHDILMEYLSDYMVPYVNISDNPTVNEVLATGRNLIVAMEDDDIRDESNLYWPKSIIHSAWVSVANPEDLFKDRSQKLNDFLINHNNSLTDISGCFTPSEETVASAMIRIYGDNPIIEDILERIAPGINDIDPDEMSFEGVFLDLLTTARYGININGMTVRPYDLYSNGASVHYRGLDDMYRHWLARPGLYKPNIIYIDDSTGITDDIINTAILANIGEIPSEVSITFQGNSKSGFYFWDNFTAHGGEEGLNCAPVDARFIVVSDEFEIQEMAAIDNNANGYEFIMQKGQYPDDAMVTVEVTSPGSLTWHELSSFRIASLLDNHSDLYVRGDNLGEESGFAYIAEAYDLYSEECGKIPDGGYIEMISW